jgi:hypothetical protein
MIDIDGTIILSYLYRHPRARLLPDLASIDASFYPNPAPERGRLSVVIRREALLVVKSGRSPALSRARPV